MSNSFIQQSAHLKAVKREQEEMAELIVQRY